MQAGGWEKDPALFGEVLREALDMGEGTMIQWSTDDDDDDDEKSSCCFFCIYNDYSVIIPT